MARIVRLYVGADSRPVEAARIFLTELKTYVIPPAVTTPPPTSGFGVGRFGETPFGE